MRMVYTGYLHLALGIELVGVGGYMGMTVLYFFGSRICYRFGPVSQETLGLLVLCGAFKGQPGHRIVPTDAQQFFIRIPRRPITANRKCLLY
jgi:hypothetical protein